MIRSLLVLIAAIVSTLSPSVAGSPAAAGTTSQRTTNLISQVLRAADGGPWETVLRLPAMSLRDGQSVYLYSQLAATTNTARGPLMGTRIVCLATGGGAGSPYSTRNHDGKAYGVETLVNRWLFTAPHDGRYSCELRGRADTSLQPDITTLHLVSDRTLLRVSPVRPGSRQFMDPADSCAGRMAIPSVEQCRTATPRVRVLRHTTATRSSAYVNVVGDVELTREYGMYPGGDSVVRTTLKATPVDAAGRACADTRRTVRTSTISSNIHHLKVNLTLTRADVNLGGGCGTAVRTAVVVTSLRGNPVTIHDATYSNGIVLLS